MSSIDLTQLLHTFIEESLEILQSMENALLEFNLTNPEMEKINCIFRAAHSIKSSSSVFGYDSISELSHTIEDYLETIRSGVRKLKQVDIEVLLKSVDCIRENLTYIRQGQGINSASIKELHNQLHVLFEKANLTDTSIPIEVSSQTQTFHWLILYNPKSTIFQNRNDPYRFLELLKDLGTLTVLINVDKLPSIEEIEPQVCYLRWEIRLSGNVTKEKILEILEWSTEKEEIEIQTYKDNVECTPASAVASDIKEEHQENKENLPSGLFSSIRVNIEKIDDLINIVGELVITQSLLNQIMTTFDIHQLFRLQEAFTYLDHNCRKLQESIMRIRMVPVEYVFNRFPRTVHDFSNKIGKKIELRISGEHTELDKTIIEKITDPLGHLIRNAVDHGIEEPSVREKKGKSAVGLIELKAYQESGNIIIEVKDDGKGIDKEKVKQKAIEKGLLSNDEEFTDLKLFQILIHPGFSTADHISDLSGRGVGLDVVYRNISEIGGEMSLESEVEKGCTVTLRLPLTLAIMDCQLVKISNQFYIFPIIAIIELLKININQVHYIKNEEYYCLRDNYIPIIRVHEILSVPTQSTTLEDKMIVIVEKNQQLYGLLCDEALFQQQVVIKNIEDNYKKIPGIAGATILGDGSIALIVDVNSIIDLSINRKQEKTAENRDNNIVPLPPPPEIEIDISKSIQILSFLIDGKEYGIDINEIMEICICDKITPLPNVPDFVKGMINLRGMLIPIIDILKCYALGEKTYQVLGPIIIVYANKMKHHPKIGLMVDALADTYHIPPEQIKKVPEKNDIVTKEHVKGLINVNEKVITLLSTNHLLTNCNR